MTSPAAPDLSTEVARIDTWQLRRSSSDLYARALIGPIFYLLAWVVILAVSTYVQRWSWPVVLPTLVYGGLWFARYRHRVPADDAPPAAFERWVRTHWLLIFVGSAAWGVVPAVVGWLEGTPNSVILVTALATMAFCTATSHSFAMHPGRARVSILLLILPGVTVFVWPSLDLRSTGITLLIYSFYLLANLRRTAAEYAHQLATELELLRSRAELALLSLTDDLTGLPNRRNYEPVWARAASNAVRLKTPLALLMLDLDHFKQVNDQHGHAAGDASLRHFAGLLRQHFRRDTDFIARLGGEEFVVVLPGTTQEAAMTFSEQLRATLAATPCRFDGVEIPLTVSIGVSVLDETVGPEVTFKRADAACYAAKDAGRNRVAAWSPELS